MNISETSKSFLKNIIILFIIELIIGVLAIVLINSTYLTGYIYGLAIGSVCSVLKLIMLDSAANRVVEMDKKDANKSFKRSYYIRYFFTIGAMLVMAVNHPRINLYAGGLGLLNMSLAAYLFKLMNKRN